MSNSLLHYIYRNIWASLVAQLVKIHLECRRPWFIFWVRKCPWRRDRLPTPVILSFPGDSDSKESSHNAGDLGSIPGLGRSHGEGNCNPLQYSCQDNLHGQRYLVGPWDPKEWDMTEWLSAHTHTCTFLNQQKWFLKSKVGPTKSCFFLHLQTWNSQ